MKKDTLNIALACFFGAVLGGFLSKSVFGGWLWGVVIGGAFGWLILEPRQTLRMFAFQWNRFRDSLPAFEEIKGDLEILGWVFLRLGLCVVVIAIICSSIVWGAMIHSLFIEGNELSYAIPRMGSPLVLCLIIGFSCTLVSLLGGGFSEEDNAEVYEGVPTFRGLGKMLLIAGPWSVYTWIVPYALYKLVRGLIHVACIIPYRKIGLTLRLAGVATLRMMNTRRRFVCLIGAAFGSVIGYLSGNVFLGGILGAVIGVIEYEVIGVRILGVRPQKSESQ